jgi:vanillate O-demethylase monooxygenase subunit
MAFEQNPSSTPPWPRNAWYVACTPDEIAERPLGRQICGERMVFYRDGMGRARALEDFCPHRGAPLSLGFLREGELVCGYHGLTMGCEGRAMSMPGQDVARFNTIQSFPVIERYGFIWVWPGDAALAKPEALHHLAWSESPDWAYGGGLYHIDCDYRLMIDNLMDLTHETYVHTGSIGQKEIDEAPVNTQMEVEQVVTSRFMHGVSAPPFWRMALGHAGLPQDAPVDRWQICRFSLPSHVMIEVGVALAGFGGHEADASKKASSVVVDFITPETETSHWYFWGMARNFAAADPVITASIREGQGKIFSEDLEMLERQQRNLISHPGRRLMTLNIDAGGVYSRRLIDRAIQAENQSQS